MANSTVPNAMLMSGSSKPAIVLVYGSHGELKVHASTGVIISRPDEYPDPEDIDSTYPEIARFDPSIFAAEPLRDRWDILATAYWTHEGLYEPALTMRLMTDCSRQSECDDWVPFALLPAPARPVDVELRTRTGSYRNFERRYEPIEQPDGSIMVDRFDHVLAALPDSVRFLWTVIEADGNLYLVNGWHFVNRIGYVWARRPWSDVEDQNPPYRY